MVKNGGITMKRFFDVFDRFMVRVPLASTEDFIQCTVEGSYVDRVANDNVFLEQLFLASPSLYSMIKENSFNKPELFTEQYLN